MSRRPPLDPAKIASYMSAKTANAVFADMLDPAKIASYVANPSFGRFGPTYEQSREVLKQRYRDEAWKDLHDADTFEKQRDAVMKLSDMIFGDDEVGAFVDALRGDIAKMAAQSATPPAVFLGTVLSKAKFYGVVTDQDSPMTATLEIGPVWPT
jgi:hypothetical protein